MTEIEERVNAERIAYVERTCRYLGFHRVRMVLKDESKVMKELVTCCTICGATGDELWAARQLLEEQYRKDTTIVDNNRPSVI